MDRGGVSVLGEGEPLQLPGRLQMGSALVLCCPRGMARQRTRSPRFAWSPGGEAQPATRQKMTTLVRPVEKADSESWLCMRQALWPESSVDEHEREIEQFFSGRANEPLAVLIADDPTSRPVGVVELSIRPYAEGCRTNRVAYLEGWFVVPEARRQGVGRALVEAAERWARTQGCSELASDTRPDNSVSIAAHRAVGFADAGLVQCYRKTCESASAYSRGSDAYR
jgi:aminoglycoside 6'-N-acetyltransferase I